VLPGLVDRPGLSLGLAPRAERSVDLLPGPARRARLHAYFGAAVEEVREGPIEIVWTGPRSFEVSAGAGELPWTVELVSTPVTSALNRVASLLPTARGIRRRFSR
jgi:hypothetical protein